MSGNDVYDENMAGSVAAKPVNQNVGLYSGNVIIEYNTDQKVVKPVIKVNEKADATAILHAVNMAIMALKESTKALDAFEFVIPDPTKQYVINENDKSDSNIDDNPINRARDKEDRTEQLYDEAKNIIDGKQDDFVFKRGEEQN